MKNAAAMEASINAVLTLLSIAPRMSIILT
jgi:hypothetical protein